jgi:hypothetical protein
MSLGDGFVLSVRVMDHLGSVVHVQEMHLQLRSLSGSRFPT